MFLFSSNEEPNLYTLKFTRYIVHNTYLKQYSKDYNKLYIGTYVKTYTGQFTVII